MADVFLFPSEPNPPDVRLREPGAAPVLHEVTAAVTATASASLSRTATLSRSFDTDAAGEAATGRQAALSRVFEVTADGVATVDWVVTNAGPTVHTRTFAVTATGEASLTAEKISRPAPGGIIAPPYVEPAKHHELHLAATARARVTVTTAVRRSARGRHAVTHYVDAAAVATAVANVTADVTLAPRLFPTHAAVTVTATANLEVDVDRAGRRRDDDELLLLIGVFD